MKAQDPLQSGAALTQDTKAPLDGTDRPRHVRCYRIPQLLIDLQMCRRTFERLRRAGKLPFLEELQPRLGGQPRFRADLVDRWLAGDWNRSRSFSSHRRSA